MKKRRELNASRMKPIKNGSHELLRSASFSSENEEIFNSDRENLPKKSSINSCYIYTLMFHIVIVITSFASIGALVWMLLQLKYQVHNLKVQLSQLSSEKEGIYLKLQDISVKCLEVNSKVSELRTSMAGVQLGSAIDAINNKISKLNKQADIASSASMKQLPKAVAEMGSSLKTLQQGVAELKASVAAGKQKESKGVSLAETAHLQSLIKNITRNSTLLQTTKLSLKLLETQESLKYTSNLTNILNNKVTLLENQLHRFYETNATTAILRSDLESFDPNLAAIDQQQPPLNRSNSFANKINNKIINNSVNKTTINSIDDNKDESLKIKANPN